MSNREEVIQGISEFISSNKRFLFLNGTHQYEKHVIVLKTIFTVYEPPASILIRVNHTQNIESIINPVIKFKSRLKTGKTYNIGKGFSLNFDTINKQSWGSSPRKIDIAVLYPLDSLNEKTGDENIQSILSRDPDKIFLVTWTDNKDFSWINHFEPDRISYDAEEEDPEYHERVKDVVNSTFRKTHALKNVPNYASHVEPEYLIRILCRGRCGKTRWARLDKKFPGQTALRNATMGEYHATCLKCGYEANDSYNWYR